MWPTIAVHVIDQDSPLYGLSAADLLNEKFEVIVILEGTTESTGQTTQARTSYLASEVLWGHRFRPLVKYCKTKMMYEVDYSQFHDVCNVDTPLCSAKDLETYLMINEPKIIWFIMYEYDKKNTYFFISHKCLFLWFCKIFTILIKFKLWFKYYLHDLFITNFCI